MKLSEATHVDRNRKMWAVVFDVPDSDKYHMGPFHTQQEAKKFKKEAYDRMLKKCKQLGSEYANCWAPPVVYVEELFSPDVLDSLIDEYQEELQYEFDG